MDRKEIEELFSKASSDGRDISYKDFELFMKREGDITKNKR
jgi:hypothetical protein